MSAVTIDHVRDAARQEWRYASPYRVGIMAARLGAPISINPYAAGSRGYHGFVTGWFSQRDAAVPA